LEVCPHRNTASACGGRPPGLPGARWADLEVCPHNKTTGGELTKRSSSATRRLKPIAPTLRSRSPEARGQTPHKPRHSSELAGSLSRSRSSLLMVVLKRSRDGSGSDLRGRWISG